MDHKPLLKILEDRSMDDIPNNRLQNLKELTLQYKFRVIHVPGVKHRVHNLAIQLAPLINLVHTYQTM